MDFNSGCRTESKRDETNSGSEREEEDSKSGFANSENIAISDEKIHLMKLTPTNFYSLVRM